MTIQMYLEKLFNHHMGFEGKPTGFISEDRGSAPQGLAAPESKERRDLSPALQELIKQANSLGPEGRDAALKTLNEQLAGCKDQIDPSVKEKLFNSDGSPNLLRAGEHLGFNERFGRHLTGDGKIKPFSEVPKDPTDQSAGDTFKIPDRDPRLPGGKDLFRSWGLDRDMNTCQPELTRKIIAEIEKGNVPDACRYMSRVNMSDESGRTRLSFDTSNGYLAVGSNSDHIIVPLSGPMAKEIADYFGWVLPTADMAMARDAQARIKLTCGGEQDISRMSTLEWAQRHNAKNQTGMREWLAEYNSTHRPPLTEADLSKQLTGGGKKNIFITSNATIDGGGIGIGGLLRKSRNPQTGEDEYVPIQPYQYPHPYNINGKNGGHGDYSQAEPIYGSHITVNEPGQASKRVALYDILRTPPPQGPPPSDPAALARYNQAVDYARYRKILNAYDGGKPFDPNLAYTTHGENAGESSRYAQRQRSRGQSRG